MTAKIISFKTGKDVTPPPERFKRLVLAAKHQPDVKMSRDVLVIFMAQVTVAFEQIAAEPTNDEKLKLFATGGLQEIDKIIVQLEMGQKR